MKNENRVRLNNELIDIFTNLPKSTNTAMSWLLLHKSLEESLSSNENLMSFNLLTFIDDYQLDIKRQNDFKKELLRDFNKLENKIKREVINKKGNKQLDTYYFFQQTSIDLETLDVTVKLNEDIYNSVSNIPEKKYFQFLKKEAIMIANKKLTPNDLKLLMYIKANSHNAKVSYLKIKISDLHSILGKTSNMYFATLKERYLEPFIERILKNTNYVISYKVQKNKLNKRKIESILFTVDNRKEKYSIINKNMDKDTIEGDEIANKHFTELETQIKDMNKHEEKVKNNIKSKKNISKEELLESLKEDEIKHINDTQLIREAWIKEDTDIDFDIGE